MFERHKCYRFLTFRSNHLASLYIQSEHSSSQVSGSNIIKDQLTGSCDFKYATCQMSLAEMLGQNLQKYPSKSKTVFCSFYAEATIQLSTWKYLKIAIRSPHCQSFIMQFHIVFPARW